MPTDGTLAIGNPDLATRNAASLTLVAAFTGSAALSNW
jgi:hypothetical protein